MRRAFALHRSTKEPGAACVPSGQVRRRVVFLDPLAEPFYGDWERVAGECVAILRLGRARGTDAVARMRDRSRASGLESVLCVAA